MRYRGIFRDYASLWGLLLRFADAIVVVVSGWLAGYIYLGGIPSLPSYTLGLTVAVLLCLVIFPAFGLYQAWRGSSVLDEIRPLTLAWIATLATLTSFAFLTKSGEDFSRGWFLIWLVLGWCLLVIGRIILRSMLRAMRHRGFNQRRIAIIANPAKSLELSAHLAQSPWTGFVVTRVVSPETEQGDDGFSELDELARSGKIDQVWISVPLHEENTLHRVIHALRYTTVDVRYLPDISAFRLLNHSITEVAGLPVINLTSSGMNSTDRLIKALEDRILAALILLLVSPLMIIVAIGVKMSSPGPVFFRQLRMGLGGQEIAVLKFRTMVVHFEEHGKVTQAHRGDNRVTAFGAWLRKTSLDEIPQFFNVLYGEMSIVGPRPHALVHNEYYKTLVDGYMARHKIKPGITGWAQVNGYRGETDTLEKMQKRVEYDLHYIENWSLWLDLRIIVLTVTREFFSPNAY